MPRNGTQKSLDRAREVYLASAQLFVERGFKATSLADVAKALNITKAGLYYYFESKEELLYRIILLGLDSVKDTVLEPARDIKNAEERLKFIILNHARLAAEGNHAVIIVSHEITSLNFNRREAMLKRRRDYFDFVRNTLVEMKKDGRLADIDITTATFTLFGMILWLPRWFQPNGKLSVEKVCRDVCQMALKGLLENQTDELC